MHDYVCEDVFGLWVWTCVYVCGYCVGVVWVRVGVCACVFACLKH